MRIYSSAPVFYPVFIAQASAERPVMAEAEFGSDAWRIDADTDGSFIVREWLYDPIEESDVEYRFASWAELVAFFS